MGSVVVYVVITVLVAAIVFVVAAVVAGRGEPLPPVEPDETLAKLPRGAVSGADARALRFGVKARGYDMAEVDWAIAELAAEIDRLRGVSPSAITEDKSGASN
ncbi:DivIVA domain-containing protein [Dietzia sp.]|uniref:DivIVA domain-containing protein n=1 Tax=Dietzia sp. TaxID=1871616 RepID=UPI002FDA391D